MFHSISKQTESVHALSHTYIITNNQTTMCQYMHFLYLTSYSLWQGERILQHKPATVPTSYCAVKTRQAGQRGAAGRRERDAVEMKRGVHEKETAAMGGQGDVNHQGVQERLGQRILGERTPEMYLPSSWLDRMQVSALLHNMREYVFTDNTLAHSRTHSHWHAHTHIQHTVLYNTNRPLCMTARTQSTQTHLITCTLALECNTSYTPNHVTDTVKQVIMTVSDASPSLIVTDKKKFPISQGNLRPLSHLRGSPGTVTISKQHTH